MHNLGYVMVVSSLSPVFKQRLANKQYFLQTAFKDCLW